MLSLVPRSSKRCHERSKVQLSCGRHAVFLSAVAALLPIALRAQTTAAVTLRTPNVASGTAGSCGWQVTHLVEEADPKDASKVAQVGDTVIVRLADADGKPTASPAPLLVIVEGDTTLALRTGDSVQTYSLPARSLANRTVRVARTEKGAVPLCADRPQPMVSEAVDMGITHHDIFAGGEVSSALRTGASASAATGSLGLHTFSYRDSERPYRFPFGFLSGLPWIFSKLGVGYKVDLEELRATISVASQGDTLFAPSGHQDYAQAILSPLTAAHGIASSVQIMYSPQSRYGTNSLRGFRFAYSATRSVWRDSIGRAAPQAPDTIAKNVTIMTFDARYHLVFVNHTKDDEGNIFSFAMDAGLTNRWITGDLSFDNEDARALRNAALGTAKTHFNGPVVGMYIGLRQVTAFAELQNLGLFNRKKAKPVESLEGWQPLIGFRFEAPMFTIKGT